MTDGLCAQVGGDIWFPNKGDSAKPAKNICKGCKVIDECLEYSIINDIRFGVWGGRGERERRRMLRQAKNA